MVACHRLVCIAALAALSTTVQAQRKLDFSGYSWIVKSAPNMDGPGPNYFSDSDKCVWVDRRGRLHLVIRNEAGHWQCPEIVGTKSLGHGTYRWTLDTPEEKVDPNIILGLFTYSMDPAYNNREIDIELSRWGQPDNKNAQYVIQPYTTTGNIMRWQIPTGLAGAIHAFDWESGSIAFLSQSTTDAIQHWTYTGADNPPPGDEVVHINLWLFHGAPPQTGRRAEVVIQKFEFTPTASGSS